MQTAGPALEFWNYYQRSASGDLEIKEVMFGNSRKTLGHVVGYDSGIVPSRIATADTFESLSAIIDYNAKHKM